MLTLSKLILLLTAVCAIISVKARKKSKVKTAYVVICGVFLAVWAASIFVDGNISVHKKDTSVFLSLMHSIQVMLAGFEFENLYECFGGDEGTYIYLAFLYSVAPVCTFGFVLSFFERFTSWIKYFLKLGQSAYIFSEINEKSLALAASARKNDAHALIVFTGCEKGASYDEAKALGAAFFAKNIKNAPLILRSKKARNLFFVIGESETENVEATLSLIEKHRKRQNTEIYTLSTSKVGGLLLDSSDKGNICVRRINESRQLAFAEISGSASDKLITCGSDGKNISVLIVGMGGYGTEFLKAALWCGQLPGYSLTVNVIDKNENIRSHFYEMCPEIIEKNGNKEKGEACYSLNFYGGIDACNHEFEDVINSLENVTTIFVALGDDERNIETAINLRTIMARQGKEPIIKAVVYSSEKHRLLEGDKLTNYKNQSYDISFIGSIDQCFSIESVTASDIMKKALAHHLSYVKVCAENEAEEKGLPFEEVFEKCKKAEVYKFNKYEYFRDSSAATAIYRTYFQKESYTDEEREEMCIYEHMRWNAYMRCEGYVFGEERNDLAKTHPDLVPFSQLNKGDINKDMKMVGTK